MDSPTINNFPPADQHFTAEDRKAIYRLEFSNEAVQKDIKEIKSDVKDIKEGISARVTALELINVSTMAALKSNEESSLTRFKENKAVGDDHERRIRWMERISYGGLALLAAAEFYLNYLHKI